MTTNSGVTESRKTQRHTDHSSFIITSMYSTVILLTPTGQGSLENVVLHALSQYNDQFHVEIYGFSSHDHERDQEEVLEKSSHHSTQGRDGRAVDGTYEHGIEAR